MNFKTSLDRYLTSVPHNDGYFELVADHYSDEFSNNMGQFENSSLETMWMERLCAREKTPEQAAAIIERAYRLYKIAGK